MPSEALATTYRVGMLLVIVGIFALLAVLAIVDIGFALHRSASIGFRLESWSRKNPWPAATLLVVFAALVAHFVLNPWPS